jgi:hypothetical protein
LKQTLARKGSLVILKTDRGIFLTRRKRISIRKGQQSPKRKTIHIPIKTTSDEEYKFMMKFLDNLFKLIK